MCVWGWIVSNSVFFGFPFSPYLVLIHIFGIRRYWNQWPRADCDQIASQSAIKFDFEWPRGVRGSSHNHFERTFLAAARENTTYTHIQTYTEIDIPRARFSHSRRFAIAARRFRSVVSRASVIHILNTHILVHLHTHSLTHWRFYRFLHTAEPYERAWCIERAAAEAATTNLTQLCCHFI